MKKFVVILAVLVALVACSACSGSSDHEGELQPPLTSSDAKGSNYADVMAQFEESGFTNVTAEGLGDLIVGFLHDENEVDEVSIGGSVDYAKNSWYAPDAKVVIRYHSYPNSSSSDSAEEGKSSNTPDEPAVSSSHAEGESEASDSTVDDERSREKAGAPAASSPAAKDYVGKTASEAEKLAKANGLRSYYYDKNGKELTDIVQSGNGKAAALKAKVSKAEMKDGFLGGSYIEFTLNYSAKKKMKAAKGQTAAKAASLAKNNGYYAEFYDKSGDEITDEITGESPVKAARSAVVSKVELDEGVWGDIASFTLDYGVPKEYKTALRKAQSYCDNMHMSYSRLYDQLTSEYGEQYSADAAQYAVDNVDTDWNENALLMAKSYQDNLDMSPAAIYDQLVSSYGEGFTPEQAQYAIDNL